MGVEAPDRFCFSQRKEKAESSLESEDGEEMLTI